MLTFRISFVDDGVLGQDQGTGSYRTGPRTCSLVRIVGAWLIRSLMKHIKIDSVGGHRTVKTFVSRSRFIQDQLEQGSSLNFDVLYLHLLYCT